MKPNDVGKHWSTFLTEAQARTQLPSPLEVRGQLTRLAGLVYAAPTMRIIRTATIWAGIRR
mgnify:CR=1 FL=1